MKFTINTDNKTIEIHGSFKFEELEIVKNLLPKEWRDFEIGLAEPKLPTLVPKEQQEFFTVPYIPDRQIIHYPIFPSKPECCGNCVLCPHKLIGGSFNGTITGNIPSGNAPEA
jgi:hypothetical protein